MKHFIAKKDLISEHQRGNGINILVFKTRVKAAVFQGIQRLHQKKVHLLARYITGWRPRAKNELLKIMQLSNIFTMQYFALGILLKIISLKKHESSKQQYWWCTYILQTEKLSQRIHSIVRFLNIVITCKPMFWIFSQLIQILNHWKTRAQNSKKNISRNAKVTFLRGCTNTLSWYHQWSFQIHLALLTLCVKYEGFPVLFFFFFLKEADKNLALYFSAFIK